MQTSQRGSVLLTIIGGIVILALLGMVAVSLMTGSVMTGLDAKETVQAPTSPNRERKSSGCRRQRPIPEHGS